MMQFDTTELPGVLEMRFSAELTNVEKAAELTSRFLAESNLQAQAFSIQLVMRELLNNAVIHGCGRDECKSVRYRLELDGTALIMQVEDEGDGFDWRAYQGGDIGLDETHGRGTLILNEYCANHEYNEKGTGVTVQFKIDQ
jgi:serine/threonine-protein kinase RsbW